MRIHVDGPRSQPGLAYPQHERSNERVTASRRAGVGLECFEAFAALRALSVAGSSCAPCSSPSRFPYRRQGSGPTVDLDLLDGGHRPSEKEKARNVWRFQRSGR
jgi:hypothetical protein